MDQMFRDYVGWAWYDTQFFVFQGWQDSRVMLRSVFIRDCIHNNAVLVKLYSKVNTITRFGSVHYTAMVYLNGQFVTGHSGGHLPFEADVTDVLKYSEK